ncbi:MAG: PA14 domain-containing protein, partial [Planctomycetota bacterium]
VAGVWRNQVRVSWSVPRNASPQLGYRIEVFDDTRARGEPMASADDNAPYVFARRFDTPRPARSVRLTVVDIFGQEKTVVLKARPVALAPRVTPAKVRQGLLYGFYTARGRWTRLPDLAATPPDKTGTVTELDDTVRENRRENYAIQYAGYVKAPADGLYVISAGTCDGSRLRVDGKQVYEYDGTHSAGVRQYLLALREGLHRFELDYFKGPKAYPHTRIDMSWEGPGFARRPFARDDFVCEDAGDLPLLSLELKTPVAGGTLVDNLAEIHAVPSLRGHKLAKIEVFVGRLLLGTAEELDGNGRAVFKSVLPKGENRVWARLWYDGNNSVNADRDLRFNVKNKVEGPWTFTLMGPDINPLGARYEDGAISFAGEGFYFAEQRITGDYTLTGRVADIILSTRANGIHGGNWVGLYDIPLFGHNKDKPVRGYGHENCGIYHTAGRGIRAMADWPDLGGGRTSSWEVVGRDHRWLRIVRRGNRITTYGSADGKTWKRASEQFCGSDVPAHSAGVIFRGIPGKSPLLYRGKVDNISLERTTPPEAARPKVDPGHLKLGDRITGVVQCREAPDRLYARSPTRGVLVSKDRGGTWKEVNRGLTRVPEAMAVRSVAVHPEDPDKVLRAGGARVGGVHKSGLWLSEDGGGSWKLLTREIDFDGTGPTALFGEVLSFADAKGVEVVAAAGESSGLSVSADAGKTWKSDFFRGAHLKGERITCMSVSGSSVLLGTFDDAEFEALGLGRPSIRAPKATTGSIYFLRLQGAKSVGFGKKPIKVKDFGVTNITFGMADRFLSFATTRGIYYSWTSGFVVTQKRSRDLPPDAFYVAMGYRRFRKVRKHPQYDWKSTAYAAPFSTPEENLLYRVVERHTGHWGAVSKRNQFAGGPRDANLNPGPTCVLPDWKDAKIVYLCNTNGIYKSTDAGRTFRLVCESRAR